MSVAVLLCLAPAALAAVSFSSAANFPAGSLASSVAIGDLNADGYRDLAVANESADSVSVLLGNGTGGFGATTYFRTGEIPVSVAIGDLNADGKPDLVTTFRDHDIYTGMSVLLGTGTGGFGAATDFATATGPASVAVGDLNADGRLDLATANNVSNSASVLLNTTPFECNGVAATVTGTPGDDVALTGTAGDDVIVGLGGEDTIMGLGGNDTICGGAGDDGIDAGAGADYVYGEDGADTLAGSAGADTILGGAGDDTLGGGDDIDRLIGDAGADLLGGGAGSDLADYLFHTVAVTASIGDGANDGEAGELDDVHGDVERIRGGSAADVLTGDADANTLIGQGGGDTLTGGGGADELQGGDGADTLLGGADNDTLQGGTGADTLQGDAGSDLADYPRTVPVEVSIGDGANDGEFGELDDVQGDIERLRGGSANDTLTGDADANTIYGGAGDDEIEGKNGNDSLYGQAGEDDLYAQDGASFRDRLYCGTEDDFTLSEAVDARNADCEVNG